MDLNRRHRPDPSTAERLVAGRMGADDAPPGYRRVAALLGDAGSGFSEPTGPAGAATVSAMAAAIQSAPTLQIASRRRSMLSKVLAAKTIAVVSVLALSASGAAAATGNLPDPVQAKVARAAKHVGVNLPNGKGVERETEGCPNPEGARNRGQYLKQVRATGDAASLEAARKSRCGMPKHSSGTPGTDAADEAPETEKAPKTHGKSGESHGKSGESHGKAGDDHGKSGEDHGKAGANSGKADGDPGPPVESPAAVETPNAGGVDTGSGASGDANQNGAGHADPAAGEGSGNSEDHPTPDDHPTAEDLPVPAPDGLTGAGS